MLLPKGREIGAARAAGAVEAHHGGLLRAADLP